MREPVLLRACDVPRSRVSDGVACGVVGVVSAIAPRGARSVRGAGGTGTAGLKGFLKKALRVGLCEFYSGRGPIIGQIIRFV